MEKLKLSIQSPFVSKNPRVDRRPTIFTRTFYKLIEEGKHPGKVLPIFVLVDADYKIFGALTFNTGGSVSFFPDFYQLDKFDHITLSRDFIKKKGHLTRIDLDGKHRKVVHLEASELANGYYHLITFAMKDGDMLMDALSHINFPDIPYEDNDEKQKYAAMIEDAVSLGHCILDFPVEDGFYCIQILVAPKGVGSEKLAVCTTAVEKFVLSPKPIGEVLNTQILELPTPEVCDFSIHILTFRVNQELHADYPFGFVLARDPIKPFLPL